MKTFRDLKFKPHYVSSRVDYPEATHAIIQFENGYGISVVFGTCFYSNGIDTYEAAIIKNNKLCYDTEITNDVLKYQTKKEITQIMKRVQELK
jgi:hypothetical protein